MPTEREFIQAARREGYSDATIQKALKSEYLCGITVTYTENGEIDVPRSDWRNALYEASGKPVSNYMWD